MMKNETKSTMYLVMAYDGRDVVPVAIFANETAAKAALKERTKFGAVGWMQSVDFFPEDNPKEL
jgi:hypothetical protein